MTYLKLDHNNMFFDLIWNNALSRNSWLICLFQRLNLIYRLASSGVQILGHINLTRKRTNKNVLTFSKNFKTLFPLMKKYHVKMKVIFLKKTSSYKLKLLMLFIGSKINIQAALAFRWYYFPKNILQMTKPMNNEGSLYRLFDAILC